MCRLFQVPLVQSSHPAISRVLRLFLAGSTSRSRPLLLAVPLVENSASHGRSSLERGEGGGRGKPFVPTKGLVLLGLNIALVAFAVRKVPTVGQAHQVSIDALEYLLDPIGVVSALGTTVDSVRVSAVSERAGPLWRRWCLFHPSRCRLTSPELNDSAPARENCRRGRRTGRGACESSW